MNSHRSGQPDVVLAASDPTVKAINDAYAAGRVRGTTQPRQQHKTLELYNHAFNHILWPAHAMNDSAWQVRAAPPSASTVAPRRRRGAHVG
jgi:hypothetical protein